MSVLLGLLLAVSCSGDDIEEGGGTKDFGAGAPSEEAVPCADATDCEDGNPCTIDHCYEGFCDPEYVPIDVDLDGHVSHICGGPDCDDEDAAVHPGVLEAPYGDEVCLDGIDNDCNGLTDEEDAGCFHCETAGDCDDGNPCTLQACVEGRCAYTDNPDPDPCDDGNPCTVNDTCFAGACTGAPVDADGDGYVDAECGGDDCDDSLAGVHPGAREGPSSDPSCEDGADNDCDGDTDTEELACQGENKAAVLTTEAELAPTETDLEVAFAVGAFQGSEVIRLAYGGEADVVYLPDQHGVRVEAMSLQVDPVSTSILLPLGTLTVELEAFWVVSEDTEDLILDPEGYFTTDIRLRIDTLATVRLNALEIVEDYPMSILSDPMSVSGRWIPTGDADGDGREEFDFMVGGAVSYGFPTMWVPILGELSATISGNVELGFRGEEF
jgi:hypothetical protein